MSRVLFDYPHRAAGHCGSGALRDLLDWAGLGWDGPPGEGLVFGLGGALAFSYLRIPGLTPPVYLVGRGGDLEVDLLRRLGAQVDLRQTDDPVRGWDWVREELDAARPVMVWADIAELPYLRVRLRMSRHDVVLIGYDDEAEIAYVVDNDREAVQEVPYDALRRARASTSFPTPTRHATFIVQWPGVLPDLVLAAADAFEASVESMSAGRAALVDAGALPKGSAAGTGIDGVRAFAEDITCWPDRLAPDAHDAALRALPAFIEKAGTGGGLFRSLQSQCCADVAARTGDRACAAAADAYRRCSAAWSALGVASARQTAGPHAGRVAGAAAVLPVLEAEAVAALRGAAASLRSAG